MSAIAESILRRDGSSGRSPFPRAAQLSTEIVAVSSSRCRPNAGGWPIQRAARTRRKWACEKTSARSVASAIRRWITRSARAAMRSAVSPPGAGWVHTVQPGACSRISPVVIPS